jgi:quercetin dioxygenase-like cupin family protein
MPTRNFVCFLLLTSLVAAQTAAPAVVPVAEEPAHHLAFENEYVRVFKVEVAPHAATLMHRHDRDYVFVTLGESEVISERQGEKPVTLSLKDGETRFTKGGFAHIARNLSDKPFRNVTVELPTSSSSFSCGVGRSTGTNTSGVSPCPAVGTADGPGVSWNGIVESDKYLVRRVTIDPGGTVELHEHTGPHLVVAVSDLHLRNNVEGQQPAELTLAGGDIKWVPNRFKHSVTNIGKEPARLVSVEFK